MTYKGHDIKYELDGQLFVWNSVKSDINARKHNITFEEAATVLIRTDTDIREDNDNITGEERYLALGFSKNLTMLLVCYCERGENNEIIRIISARKATIHEQKFYKGGL